MSLNYFGFGLSRFLIIYLICNFFVILLSLVFDYDRTNAVIISTYLAYFLYVLLGYICTKKADAPRYINSFFLFLLINISYAIFNIVFGYISLNNSIIPLVLSQLAMQLGALIFFIKTKFVN